MFSEREYCVGYGMWGRVSCLTLSIVHHLLLGDSVSSSEDHEQGPLLHGAGRRRIDVHKGYLIEAGVLDYWFEKPGT